VITAPTVGPFIALVLTMLFFSLKSDRFFQAQNFSLVLQQVMIVGVLAIGQTLVILTAGIDLSVGTVMALGQVIMTKLAVANGVPALPALLLGILTCVAFGVLHGGLVTGVRLPPFIVTLGTLNVFFALNLYYSKSETVRGVDMSDLLLWTGNTISFGDTKITYGSLIMLGLFVAFWWVLKNTAWGRHVYATGDDAEAARLSGVRTDRVLLSVYIVAGLICAVAAWMLIGRIASASPQAGGTANLDSITAVVIGGTSLFGGRGRTYAALLGILVIQSITNGMLLLNVDSSVRFMVTAGVLALAVAIDSLARKGRPGGAR
jgi:fructose transport system permease protein